MAPPQQVNEGDDHLRRLQLIGGLHCRFEPPQRVDLVMKDYKIETVLKLIIRTPILGPELAL